MTREELAEALLERYAVDPEAGTVQPKPRRMSGYATCWLPKVNGSYAGRGMKAHHLMWYVVHGELPPEGMQIDHIDRDTLYIHPDNLRLATNSQNQFNKGPQRNNTSGFKGVYWSEYHRNWRALIRADGKKKHLGCFTNKLDAARAYNEAALKYHGEYAYLNEIPE